VFYAKRDLANNLSLTGMLQTIKLVIYWKDDALVDTNSDEYIIYDPDYFLSNQEYDYPYILPDVPMYPYFSDKEEYNMDEEGLKLNMVWNEIDPLTLKNKFVVSNLHGVINQIHFLNSDLTTKHSVEIASTEG